jgi:Na+/H+-dicarboxylate symporter
VIHRHLTWAVLAAAVLGVILARVVPGLPLADAMALLKFGFLAALKLVIAPLIFFSLLSGVLHLADARRFRSLGTLTIFYYLLTTSVAVALGLGVVYFVHPWTDAPPLPTATLPHATLIDLGDATVGSLIKALLAQALVNPVKAIAELNILGIVTNALLFGIAALFVLPAGSSVPKAIHELTRVIYRVTGWIVNLMPIGVLAIVFELARMADLDLLRQLAEFMGVVFAATAVHGLLVLPAIAWLARGIAPWTLLRAIARPMLVAFTTSSSSATLPVSMHAAETELGVDASTSSFVLPLGATMNMDGTALFEGIAAVFLAHLFGIDLGTIGTVTVFIMAMLSSIGAPGVPSGSMAGMQMVMLAVGIPLEAIGILLLVERPLDTFRTAVNVEGDLIGCLVVDGYARRAQPD